VPTFAPGGVLAQYKCVDLTFIQGGATNRYKCEAFVPGVLGQAPTSLCERTFVPFGALIYAGGKNTRYKSENGSGYMCYSLVVGGRCSGL
jgi:hypothetical protein